jgi:hypothetical protein
MFGFVSYVHPANGRSYTQNLSGDDQLRVFLPDHMNVLLEQYDIDNRRVTYNDLTVICTCMNHDRHIRNLPTSLTALHIKNAMCETVSLENCVNTIEQVCITRTNLTQLPSHMHQCTKLHTLKCNFGNIHTTPSSSRNKPNDTNSQYISQIWTITTSRPVQ